MKKIAVLTGAGVSAESGIKTFRDADGLWEGHDVMEVASPQGFAANPSLVLDFYNQRRRQLAEVLPNTAHHKLAELEKHFEVAIVTQNVDDLHERAGSTNIIHLHGELTKARNVADGQTIYDCPDDIVLGSLCPDGADIIIIIGTSMQVYPAAGLIGYAQPHADIYYIDPRPSINYELQRARNLTVIEDVASNGMQELFEKLVG